MAADQDNIRVGSGFFTGGGRPVTGQAARINAAGSVPRTSSSGRGVAVSSGRAITRRLGGGSPVRSTRSGNYSSIKSAGGPPAASAGPIQPVAPDIDTYLNQDTGYQQQLREFGNALTQFLADVTRRKGSLESEFGASSKAMNDQKVIDLDNLEDDYGARGVLRSGLYADAVGDYNTEFNTRMTDLTRRQKEAMGLLEQETGRYKSQQGLQQQAAREEAIRRRAEKFGV